MGCTITVSVVEESLDGDIGDDWKYAVAAAVSDASGKVIGSGRIVVGEHLLKPGSAQPPPKAAGVKVHAGECGARLQVELAVDATEVDWLVDDPGTQKTVVAVECPKPGKPPVTVDSTIAVKVRESPGVLGGEATFKLKLRLVAVCVYLA